MEMVKNRAILYLKMIKFSHSVFALPFAFTSAILAASGVPTIKQIFWIAVAMVGARSGAMGMNRIIDRRIDAKNPRTEQRELPTGRIKVRDAAIFVLISFAVLIFAAYNLNPLCFKLAPLAILIVIIYSYTKRFTWTSHFILGLAISGAPLGAWIAVRGTLDIEIVPLCVGIVFWLAGFDTLYALQDIEFDRSHGLYSIPRRFGIKKAILFSRIFHFITMCMLAITGIIFNLNFIYWIGMAAVAGLLLYEHSLVKADDLSRLNMAFFNMNGYISITVFVFTLGALLL
jgi:4-hydroxybenzoate polyprenyltransferase